VLPGQTISGADARVGAGNRGDLRRALEPARRRVAGLETRATELAGEVASLVAANAGLQRENERLRGRVAELERLAGERGLRDDADFRRRIAALERRVAELERELLEARRATKRQASQFDDTKNAILKVVADEIRRFLETSHFADELARILTTLSFEITTTVRFVPNADGRKLRPWIASQARLRRRGRPRALTDALEQRPAGPRPMRANRHRRCPR